ncbi:TrmB family transcriptional regulator [Streptosporangium sp. NPDC000396]|uniref:TrmB family transcriptional regulator n=1 Tax=Streptosporangium sp. NPDC000396 TaxID=3366185 RepID=UPI0036949196
MRNVVEQLQRLGMSGYEAKAYLTLVGAGQPLNGYEVAKRSGVPRSTVYETLSKLVAKGAAYELHGAEAAVDYLPLPPQSLLERMRRDFNDSMESLQASLPKVVAPPKAHPIHNLKDAEGLLIRAEDVVAASRADLFLSIWPEEMRRLSPLIKRAVERGVDTSVMHFGPAEDAEDTVGHLYEHRFSAPDAAMENLGCRLLVVVSDQREVLVGGLRNGSGWGIYTQDPAMVLMAVEYIRHEIALQIVAGRIGHESLREFWTSDPELTRLRAGHGHPTSLLHATGMPDSPRSGDESPD